MTDVPNAAMSVPSRLGTTARFEAGRLLIDTEPHPTTLHHGLLRTSVLAFAVDAVAGISVDEDPDAWCLTTDMSLRMRALPPPGLLTATSTVLRQGRRSVTCKVEVTAADGTRFGTGAVGFAKVPRREGDPPKPSLTAEQAPSVLRDLGALSLPVRDEAGIEVLDAAAGTMQLEVTPQLRNPAGTLQGAMVALLAESAAEDLVAARIGAPAFVVDLDLRYLRTARSGTVRTRSRTLDDDPCGPVEVELVDVASGDVTTLAYARAVPVTPPRA